MLLIRVRVIDNNHKVTRGGVPVALAALLVWRVLVFAAVQRVRVSSLLPEWLLTEFSYRDVVRLSILRPCKFAEN